MTDAADKPHHTGHRKRLRDRFLSVGPQALADYELLEMILFPARPIGDVKPLAKLLIAKFGSFGKVLHAEQAALLQVDGVNEAAVAAIKVAKAAAERLLKEEVAERPVIQSWTALLDYCRLHLGHEKVEQFHVLFLDHKHGLIGEETLQRGTINHTSVYPREVLKKALDKGAAAIILVHNHPSGDVTPSKADIDATRLVKEALGAANILLHDHVIVGVKKHFSFKSSGLL